MELINNQFFIQNKAVLDICKEFGQPLYLYDGNKIIEQIEKIKQSFKGLPLQIKYAIKALSNISILKLIKTQNIGLDAVSIQEVELGIKAGFAPSQILFTPNCVSFEEIEQAVALGAFINIDNISILEQFGHRFGNSVPCCIRLNPHLVGGGNSKIQTGHIDSKFGISVLQIRHLKKVIKANNIKVTGLHIHTGSDILDAEVFLRGADIVFEIALEFPELSFIDFGSGFKVAYRKDDVTTNLEQLGEALTKRYKEFCTEFGKDIEIWFEPGKYIVSEAGYFLVKTNVVKHTPANVFVGIDTGLNHLIRPMMYDAYHEIVNISNPVGADRIYNIVGYICETDTFASDRKLSEVREGDILAIKNAGAYGFSMASNYNSRLRPAEVLIYQDKTHLIRKAETLNDLLQNQIEVVL